MTILPNEIRAAKMAAAADGGNECSGGQNRNRGLAFPRVNDRRKVKAGSSLSSVPWEVAAARQDRLFLEFRA